jgi:hypothetical protein
MTMPIDREEREELLVAADMFEEVIAIIRGYEALVVELEQEVDDLLGQRPANHERGDE